VKEKATNAQEHFINLRQLLGYPILAEADPTGMII
jgi:hypothetical protein